MRIPAPVSLGLIAASVVVSAVLWRQLHAERQLTTDLNSQLAEARAALAARPQPQLAAASPQLPAATPAAAPPATPPEKATVAAATATLLADSAMRQKKLLADSEFRKARIAELRSNLQLRMAGLIKDLGLSQQEADALCTLLAEDQLRQEEMITEQMAAGNTPDAATIAELERGEREQAEKLKKAVAALLGPERATEYQEYQQTRPSRQRVNNITTMLSQSGKPLTTAQSKSLTTLLIAEQRRQEEEAKALAAAGQPFSPQSQADRAIEGDRRVLAGAASFLDAQQVEMMRARFEQVRTRNRAAAGVQQRVIEAATQDGSGN